MRLFGKPAPPKPPNMIVAPSGISATAASTVGKTLFFLPISREGPKYPGWGSNPHDALASGDFKSPAYAIPPPGPGMAKLSYQIAYGNMGRMELASKRSWLNADAVRRINRELKR